ncbi:hypothetical protein ARMSODRAFT_876894 [Armillaria solidipes]|uniref:SWIM-type domain-containing protein n=1 Tax=Armillaria solidipes TaxID=1076256 RepID=A0A2H3C0G8_9AGAR|nr:hypothetical protein ARMSODRAFT_876894 [Armillaria solidipes]
MISSFSNDSAFISTNWLLQLINGRGLNVKYLFCVQHLGPTGAEHYLAVLPDDRYICDCCMGLNLGVPCCHYFQVLSKSPNLRFNVGIVHARWYQDPLTDLSTIATVGQDNVTALSQTGINCLSTMSSSALSGVLLSSPLEKSQVAQVTISNTTVPSQMVFHELQAAFRPLIAGVQTNEQLQLVLDHLASIQYMHLESL